MDPDDLERDEDEFARGLRDYQQRIISQAVSKNVIVFLPTGAGKTFIAVQLIRLKSWQTRPELTQGGKRSFFLVYRKSLAEQQAKVIAESTDLKVGSYTGDMNVDFWSESHWKKELRKHNVFVMTADIMKIILEKLYIRLDQVNLIIFDECHHAVGNSPYSQIMQKFDDFDVSDQPLVLGLSATLLNRNTPSKDVETSVEKLETTFRAVVAAADNLNEVMKYCANPDKAVFPYDKVLKDETYRKIISTIDAAIEQFTNMKFTSDNSRDDANAPPRAKLEKRNNSRKRAKNILDDIKHNLEDLSFVGSSLATLYFLIQFYRLQLACDVSEQPNYSYAISICNKIQLYINMKIGKEIKTEHFSDKILQLAEVLKVYNMKLVKSDKSIKCLVFVTRRSTAVILYHALKKLKEMDSDLDFMSHDFIIGSEVNPFKNSREGAMDEYKTQAVLNKFRGNLVNILITTSVIDEGIDVQECNLIIRYDEAVDYRSFVQSKGRARQKGSYFVILTENKCKTDVDVIKFTQTEETLKKLLIGKSDYRVLSTSKAEDPVIPPLYSRTIDGVHISAGSAIGVLNRYCGKLPQDSFSDLSPIWWTERLNDGKVVYIGRMPTVSNLLEDIRSDPMLNKKLSKQSAAIKICEKLYEIGEFDERLNPRKHDLEKLSLEEKNNLFPHWKEEKTEDGKIPGTKSRRQTYEVQFAQCLNKCRPQKNEETYMHILQFTPLDSPPLNNHRREVIHSLFISNDTYALLTSKPIPPIFSFPLYQTSGEVLCRLKVNSQVIKLNAKEIKNLERFHFSLFHDIMPIAKNLSFLIFDSYNLENSYLIAPVSLSKNSSYDINWNVIESADISSNSLVPKHDVSHYTVVSPTHRELKPKPIYIVTKVCHDMSPLSPFPSYNFPNFTSYYKCKYNKTIKDLDQPLLEVKQISRKINYLKPRKPKPGGIKSRRKIQEELEESEEHLIPELCEVYVIPSVYWVKCNMLPSALHRIHTALIVNEFRLKVVKETNLGQLDVSHWANLSLDEHCEKNSENILLDSPTLATASVPLAQKHFNSLWDSEEEPIDIERNFDNAAACDIEQYMKFAEKSIQIQNKSKQHDLSFIENLKMEECPLNILTKTPKEGPELKELVEVFTSKSSNDIINYERLETLGDSFLKFAVSFSIFRKFKQHEGLLTQIKGQIIGNRNLLYCGQHHGIPPVIKLTDLSPYSDWVPPSLLVHPVLKSNINKKGINPHILHKIKNSYKAQIGEEDCDFNNYVNILNTGEKTKCDSTMENFVSLKTIPDKIVADCVEALIGVYVKNCGIFAGYKILSWLNILNGPEADPKYLFDSTNLSPYITNKCDNVDNHLKNVDVDALEQVLNYKFRNKGYLLQALTHPSYIVNRLTECYQRLEFLGDSILDFLITVYIYENCKTLNPGQITDLRSALVNNVTFSCLVVRYGLHRYLLHSSPPLMSSIMNFAVHQNERNHVVNEATYTLLEEGDCHIAEGMEVPKALGDLFESLAGAIFLDSGCSLSTVWRTFYNLMKDEIKLFSTSVPKSAVRLLYERLKGKPHWHKNVVQDTNICHVACEIKVNGKLQWFNGFGKNNTIAKVSAAKHALKAFNKDFM